MFQNTNWILDTFQKRGCKILDVAFTNSLELLTYHGYVTIYNPSSVTLTTWKVSKYGVFPGPYFPVFGLNMGKTDQKKLRIWSLFTQCFYEGVFFLWVSLTREYYVYILTSKILHEISSPNFTSDIKQIN